VVLGFLRLTKVDDQIEQLLEFGLEGMRFEIGFAPGRWRERGGENSGQFLVIKGRPRDAL